jgi:hypothetical protein
MPLRHFAPAKAAGTAFDVSQAELFDEARSAVSGGSVAGP